MLFRIEEKKKRSRKLEPITELQGFLEFAWKISFQLKIRITDGSYGE